MKRHFALALFTASTLAAIANAQEPSGDATETIRERLGSYVETFNKHDAEAMVMYWTADAVSVQEGTGERTEGREALQKEFQQFFADYPQALLSGSTDHVRMIGADVAVVEGAITLATGLDEPVQSTFTAVLKKQDDQWLIASSHERDVPTPTTSYEALRELEWAIGSWQDEIEGAKVTSTIRWSPSQAFLIRSYQAEYEDGDGTSGTQIFGWDPLAKQIRTWTFNSDGSFGDGTVSRNGDEWMVKMNQVQSDGTLASGTTVITKIDDNTLQIHKIGESLDGEPVPSSDPITVVRIAEIEEAPAEETAAVEGASR